MSRISPRIKSEAGPGAEPGLGTSPVLDLVQELVQNLDHVLEQDLDLFQEWTWIFFCEIMELDLKPVQMVPYWFILRLHEAIFVRIEYSDF